MMNNSDDSLNPNRKVIHTEMNANWFDSMSQHANAKALEKIKIVLLQNLEEEAIQNTEDPNRLEPTSAAEDSPSGGSHSDLDLIEFGRRSEVQSQFRTLSMIATVFKDVKAAILPNDKGSETPVERNEVKPIFTVLNLEVDSDSNFIKVTVKLDGIINQPIHLHYEMPVINEYSDEPISENKIVSGEITFHPTSDPIQIVTINLPASIVDLQNLIEPVAIQINLSDDIILNQIDLPLEKSPIQDLTPQIPPHVTVEDIEIAENSTATFHIKLDRPANSLITIDFTTAPGTAITGGSGLLGQHDYEENTGTITILPGQTEVTLSIQIIDDHIYEETEYFILQLTHINGGEGATLETDEVYATIIDNDDNSPIAVGDEQTILEYSPDGEPTEIDGNLFSHDSPGNNSGTVFAVKLNFQDDHAAHQYLNEHSELTGVEINNNIIQIPISNGTITTPLGGTISIQPNGDYSYKAPYHGVSEDSTDVISYVLNDLDGDSAEANLTFHITDLTPHATNDTNYITQPIHSYNLVLAIDISGSMNDSINGQTRLNIAKNALVELINNYNAVAQNLHITIVPFGSGNNNAGAFSYTASSIQDALDYITMQGAHQTDGVSIGMINPDTNQALQAGTQYNDALYHARDQLQADLINPLLQNYESRVYFLSDGQPTSGHSATDTSNWPIGWGSWQDYINQNNIKTYAISIAAGASVAQALEPIANQPNEVP